MKNMFYLIAAVVVIALAFILIRCEPTYLVKRGNTATNNSSKITENTSLSFEELMKKDALDKDARAAEAVGQFLNDQISDPRAAILIKNNTDCNIIVNISGNGKTIQLPVEKRNVNYITLDKKTYHFASKLCRSSYQSTKKLTESIEISLSEK